MRCVFSLYVTIALLPLHATAASASNGMECRPVGEVVRCASGEVQLVYQQFRLPTLAGSGEHWIPGLHYSVLLPPQEYFGPTTDPVRLLGGTRERRLVPGKVELLEINHYRGFASITSTPEFRKWQQSRAGDVHMAYIPWVFSPHSRLQARMYYTLEELGRGDLHGPFREWVMDAREAQRFATYEEHWHPDEEATFAYNLAFAEAQGLDRERFVEIYRSQRISDQVMNAESLSGMYHADDGSPTYVINRIYSVNLTRLTWPRQARAPEDARKLVALIDYLTESELSKCYLVAPDLKGKDLGTLSRRRCKRPG